jgi:hypothetical protein
MAEQEGDEDDYLTMTIVDTPHDSVTETYSQRRARKLREHETNRYIKPAKELEKERREEGLAKSMFAEQHSKEMKAMRMMKIMGYKYSVRYTWLIVDKVRGLEPRIRMPRSSHLRL